MMTTWTVYNGHVYKVWRTEADGWCVSIHPKEGRAIAGFNSEGASDFDSRTAAEVWARDWIEDANLLTALAV